MLDASTNVVDWSTCRLIERKRRTKQPQEGEQSSTQPKFDLLTTNGTWRLIFTTGDLQTQKAIGGKLTYVPIKAVQVSQTSSLVIGE